MAGPETPELTATRPLRTPRRDHFSLILAALFGLLASGTVSHVLYQSDRETWLDALLVLLLGLAGTVLLVARLADLTRRARAADQQVARDTETLIAANRRLRRDANEREQSLRTLSEHEARYRLLADHASDIISRHDIHGIITYVSPACRDILGYEPDDLEGRPALDFIPPEDQPSVRERVRKALAGDGACTVTFRVHHRDGRVVWLETMYRVLPADGADFFESVAISRDVTARMEAERALRDSESLFRRVFDGAAVGMALVSPAGTGFLRVNHALASMLGYGIAELEEMRVADVTHPADQHISPSEIQQVLSGAKDSFLVEKRYLHKNGSTVWVLGYTTLIREPDGEPRYFVSQIQDVTEHKRALQRLSQLSYQQELILNAVGEGIFGVDPTGHATFVNRAAAEMLGYEPADLAGVDIHARAHHTLRGSPLSWRDSRIFRSIRNRETHYVDDEVFWHRDGHPIRVQYVSSPIVDRDLARGAVVVFSELEPAAELGTGVESGRVAPESGWDPARVR